MGGPVAPRPPVPHLVIHQCAISVYLRLVGWKTPTHGLRHYLSEAVKRGVRAVKGVV